MAFGLRIFQVQGAAKGLEGIVVRLFQLLEGHGQAGGAVFDLLF